MAVNEIDVLNSENTNRENYFLAVLKKLITIFTTIPYGLLSQFMILYTSSKYVTTNKKVTIVMKISFIKSSYSLIV